MRLPEKVSSKLRDIPDEPGCYMMRDRSGRIIYVGKAVSLRKRVRSYFRDATMRRADPKLRGLVKSTEDIDWLVVRNEADAILTEGRLIKDYRPRYNVSFRDDKQFPLLRADPNRPFPSFSLCRMDRNDGALYFGPYASSAAARVALDFAGKRFGLRKCTPRLPDEKAYRHCINDIVRFCSAPCVGKVTAEQYRELFNEACAFLRGERPACLRELREKMEEAASARDFERAAAMRDSLFLLESIFRGRARVVATPEMKREEAIAGIRQLQKEIGLTRKPRIIEAFDISNISGTYSVAGMVCSIDGVPHRNLYRRFRIKTVEGSNDPAMIAEVVRRRYGRALAEKGRLPDLVLVDGGITQLNAAKSELEKLGLAETDVIALAKKFEEVYRLGDEGPAKMQVGQASLKILQRLRDEAHRFAIEYHRRIRARRIRESMLDEVPGVGESKKKALLKAFGSVRRLAKASEEQIARVPGIGYKLAVAVKDVLASVEAQGRN